MHTANPYDLHDHAGARWLVPFLAILVAATAMLVAILMYPHRFGY